MAELVDKGTLIEFRLHGERRLAVAERPEGKKDWIFLDERGQSHKLRPQRIEYEIGNGYGQDDIGVFLAEANNYIDPSSLEVAWELLVEDKAGVTPQEMAKLLFSASTPAHCYAAYSLLCEDKIYFKKKADSYEPRSQTQVEEIRHQIEVEQQKQIEKEDFLERVQIALAGGEVDWAESDRLRLNLLEKLVLNPEKSSRPAQDLLTEIGRSQTPQAALELLIELGWWNKHENLFLRRSSYPTNFPQKVIEVAKSSLLSQSSDADTENRIDLTHFKVYTIDDESTKEIDDGLSVETLEDGTQRLWIHIADPTRLISPGDELDLEARRRSTSLYLPTGSIPMFPQELATGPMSLVQGQVCPALSFGVILDENGGIQDYIISASLIKPTYRLTYDDVDEMLQLDIQAEPEITNLGKWSTIRHNWRITQGSISIHMPESSIKVKDDDEIIIELLEDSPARQLVAEMMILTGEVAGSYGQKHNLPLPYRGQPQPELPSEEELLQLPAGPVRFCALRRCMPRSETSIMPIRHAGLGLNTYTQATSPIRRYNDLLAHFQIKAHLRDEPLPFSTETLKELIYSVTSAAQEATLVERQTNRYWGLEFLRRNADQAWPALLLRWLREDDNLGLILLEDLGLELPHRFRRSIALGDRLEVQVSRADPRQDVIQFRELLEKQQQEATAS